MPAVPKLPISKTFKRGVKGGLTPSSDVNVERTIPLGPFLAPRPEAQPPNEIDHATAAAPTLAPLLGNDSQGNTVVAAALRLAAVLGADPDTGAAAVPTTQEATSQYVMICGPGDVGGSLVGVLEWWTKKGLKCGGTPTKIHGYARLTAGDRRQLKLSVCSLRGAILGIALTRAWYEDAAPGFTWDATDSPVAAQIAVTVVGYSAAGLSIAWAGLTGTLTWAAYERTGVVLEGYALFGEEWATGEMMEELGWNVSALTAALAAVAAGQTPVIPTPAPAAAPAATPSPAPSASQTTAGTATMTIAGQTVTLPISITTDVLTGAQPITTPPSVMDVLMRFVVAACTHQLNEAAECLVDALALLDGLPDELEQEQFLADIGEALTAARDTAVTESA